MAAASERQELAALIGRAVALEAQGRRADAAALYRGLLERDPRHLDGIVQFGMFEARGEDPWRALPHFERALALAPRAVERHLDLAVLLLHLNRPDRARPVAEAALRLAPDHVEALRTLSKCDYQLGRAHEAQRILRRALELRPGDVELALDLALCLDTDGDAAGAQALCRGLIAAGERSALAFDVFARVQRFSSEPPELARIDALLAEAATPPAERAMLHRAAGKIADDLGRHDAAFAHFVASKAPELGRAQAASAAARVALLRELVTPARCAALRAAGSPVARPIFVFGMPRSGTTLVEQILASHPAVHGANELSFFLDEAHRAGLDASDRTTLTRAVDAVGSGALADLARDYLRLLAAHSDSAERVVDKMPLNFEVLWLIALAFPRATFVHCRRDPVATCVSCFTQPLGPGHAYANDLGALGAYHRSYRELMAHWSAVLPVKILDLDYERLLDDQEGETRRLIAHAGLPWDDACLRFHERKREVRTPSRRQVEQPIYRSGLQAWRRYERHLGPLLEALGPGAASVGPAE